jgi:hypothetical protein
MARPSQRFPRCLTEADAGRRVVNLRPSRGRLGEQPRAHASWFQVSAQPTCGALGCWKTSPGLADRQARGAGRGGQRRRAGHRGPRTVRPDNRPEAGGGAFPAVPGHAQQRDRRHRRDHDREGEPPGAKARARTGRARTREVKLAVFFTQDEIDDDGYPVRDRESASYIATFEPAATSLPASPARSGCG